MDKWQTNIYLLAKQYADDDVKLNITEKNKKYAEKHLRAISKYYVELYEEKKGKDNSHN